MILSIHLIPGASLNEVVGWYGGALKVRIAAPPVEGKSNEELIRFLAKKLRLTQSEIEITSGTTSKRKKVKIPMAESDVLAMLISPP